MLFIRSFPSSSEKFGKFEFLFQVLFQIKVIKETTLAIVFIKITLLCPSFTRLGAMISLNIKIENMLQRFKLPW